MMKINIILSFLLSGAALAQSPGAFTTTGSMITPRFGHTATLLHNGKVLIAGGGPNIAELYDPIAGAFAATGAMLTIRPIGGILLPNSKVLFAESDFTGGLATIEIYDPSAGGFEMAGRAATLTLVASAALLNDGTVLLTGLKLSGFESGAEIYNPVSESFRPIDNWPQDVGFVSALAVLVDGLVLVDYPALYNPVAGTFTKLGIWPFNDTPPAALLPDGNVLITGGNTDGGNSNWASLFDSTVGALIQIGSMASVRDGHTANLLPDGNVLIAGGATTFNSATDSLSETSSAEIYDPATGVFSPTGSMSAPRVGHAAVVLSNGRVLISGGNVSSSPEGHGGVLIASSAAEIYTPAVLIPAPVLFSLSGDGTGQGAIWHAATEQIASVNNPAIAGEALSMYTTGLASGGLIPPQVAVGGRLAEVLFFGAAPGYTDYYQVNFRVPSGAAPGPAVTVRLTYNNRPSNEVKIGVQ